MSADAAVPRSAGTQRRQCETSRGSAALASRIDRRMAPDLVIGGVLLLIHFSLILIGPFSRRIRTPSSTWPMR